MHARALTYVCMYLFTYICIMCVCLCFCISKSVWNNLLGQRYTAQAIVFIFDATLELEDISRQGWRWPTSSQARFTSSNQLKIWHVENGTSLIFTIRTHRSNVTHIDAHAHVRATDTYTQTRFKDQSKSLWCTHRVRRSPVSRFSITYRFSLLISEGPRHEAFTLYTNWQSFFGERNEKVTEMHVVLYGLII